MFGRGNKQPAAPKAPWALQFLTTEYVVAGLAAADDYMIGSDNIFYEAGQNQGAEAFQFLSLSGVRLESAGGLAAAPETWPAWNLGLCANLVAVIPADEPSRAAAQAAYPDYRQPLRVALYVGPYVVSGSYLADPGNNGVLFGQEKSLRPLVEAEIDCRLPGSKLKGWRVPYLLLHGRQVHGYRLL